MDQNNEVLLSSPDPLGMSQENLGTPSPTKRRDEKSILTPKKALIETSNNVQTQEFYITTPSGPRHSSLSPAKRTSQANDLTSPWRIRVTVQAEQEKLLDNSAAKQNSHGQCANEKITTTTIPLNDADYSSKVNLGKSRGRPRKSSDGAGKRSGTPNPRRNGRGKTPHISLNEPMSETPQIALTPKRIRGRSKKSIERSRQVPNVSFDGDDSVSKTFMLDDSSESGLPGGEGRGRSKGGRKAVTPVKVAKDLKPVDRTSSACDSKDMSRYLKTLGSEGGINHELRSEHAVANIATNMTTDNDAALVKSMDLQDNQSANSIADQKSGSVTAGKPSGWAEGLATERSHTDPTNEHQEFDSILESEGFSMVSVSSLPSAKMRGGLSAEDESSDERSHVEVSALESKAILSELWLDGQNRTENSQSKCDSSQNKNRHVENTPSVVCSYPSLPPPLRSLIVHNSPRTLDQSIEGTPKLVRVVRAGHTLQGVLDPQNIRNADELIEERMETVPPKPLKSCETAVDGLFSGFGAGTRRELRAGLRLGEELAKSHRTVVKKIATNPADADDVFSNEADTEGLGPSNHKPALEYSLSITSSNQNIPYPTLLYPQLPSPDRSEVEEDRMSWKAASPARLENPIDSTEHKDLHRELPEGATHGCNDTTMLREAEYQCEREAVINQIEMANSSQVIILQSDGEESEHGKDEGMEESDIWQEEARSSEPLPQSLPEGSLIYLQSQALKPRRSQIPSPWRRQEHSSVTVASDAKKPDPFWQPSRGIKRTQDDEAAEQLSCKKKHKPLGDLRNSRIRSLEKSSQELMAPKPNFRVGAVTSTPKPKEISTPDPDESDEMFSDGSSKGEESQISVLAGKGCGFPYESPRSTALTKRAARESAKKNRISTSSPNGLINPSTSWLSYLTSFLPIWATATSKVLPILPNGKRKFRWVLSDEPLCPYTPWTINHHKALYFHYAAAREGRAPFRFGLLSPTFQHLGASFTYQGWSKRVTMEDIAIADAFLDDLKNRSYTHRHGSEKTRIGAIMVLQMVFVTWRRGVIEGECEIGIGTTGLAEDGSGKMWRPEMESWWRSRNGMGETVERN